MERDGEEEDRVGGQHDLDGDDDLKIQQLPKSKQLVRRRYRLRVGVKRDGLLQPTVSNYFKLGGGQIWDKPVLGLRGKWHTVQMCRQLQWRKFQQNGES